MEQGGPFLSGGGRDSPPPRSERERPSRPLGHHDGALLTNVKEGGVRGKGIRGGAGCQRRLRCMPLPDRALQGESATPPLKRPISPRVTVAVPQCVL
jgi:hypothetical protein